MREYSYVWTGLVLCSTDLYPEELYEDIKQAYEEDLIESFIINFEYVEDALDLGKEKVLARLKNNEKYGLITDTIKEMEWWACFEPPTKVYEFRKRKKIGRNDPCPCGSGRKFKKCCGKT